MHSRLGWGAVASAGIVSLMPLASPVAAAPAPSVAPSFDCRRASSRSEKLICGNPPLARLDHQIADRYKALLPRLGGAAAAQLKQDQKWFVFSRDNGYTDTPTVKDMADALRHRLAFLNAVQPAVPAGIVGTWRNVTGEIEIVRGRSGGLKFHANTAEPSAGRWVCEAQGDVAAAGPRQWHVAVTDPVDGKISFSRQGPVLVVKDTAAESQFCGMNGSLGGTYFAVAETAR